MRMLLFKKGTLTSTAFFDDHGGDLRGFKAISSTSVRFPCFPGYKIVFAFSTVDFLHLSLFFK
jgi:hypothetical protein